MIQWKLMTHKMLKSFFDFLKPYIEETIFKLKLGAKDKVPHFVFISTCPDLMQKKNMSTDTIYCDCCEFEKK